MERIELRRNAAQEALVALFAVVLLSVAYYFDGTWFHLGRKLALLFWVFVPLIVVALPIRLALGVGRAPCVVLDSEGVLDTRLKVGLIRWRDIRQPYLYTHNGVEYVCLELHNAQLYKERMPAWGKVSRALEATSGLPPFAISVNFLDVDAGTLLAHIHRGCSGVYAAQA